MEDLEVNKTIECYMGYSDAFNPCDTPYEKNTQITRYTESLDALVPVWEKLGIEHITAFPDSSPMCFKISKHIDQDNTKGWSSREYKCTDFKQAAAYATAKAIKALNE